MDLTIRLDELATDRERAIAAEVARRVIEIRDEQWREMLATTPAPPPAGYL